MPRTKADRLKVTSRQREDPPSGHGKLLTCGHRAKGAPGLSNPEKWWCCGGWRKARTRQP